MRFVCCLGLLLSIALGSVCLGQGSLIYNQGQSEQNQPDDAEQATQAPALFNPQAFPVFVIENKEQVMAAKKFEQSRQRREQRDLEAQESMATSTMLIGALTLGALFLTLIGTVLLGYTLYLTRQANQAAQASVDVTREIGEKQTRAYIRVKSGTLSMSGDYAVFRIDVENTGVTPAQNVSAEASYFDFKLCQFRSVTIGEIRIRNHIPIKGSDELRVKGPVISADWQNPYLRIVEEDIVWSNIKARKWQPIFCGKILYTSVFSSEIFLETPFSFAFGGEFVVDEKTMHKDVVAVLETTFESHEIT